MNPFKSLLFMLLMLSAQAFTLPQPNRHPTAKDSTTATATYTTQVWYPPIQPGRFQAPLIPMPEHGIMDTVATLAASWILDNLPSQQATSQSQEKLHLLSDESLTEILLQDIHERNSLVTADFTPAIYEDTCSFKDGSDLDGAYPMKPWILGCKMLFNGAKSKAIIIEDSLVISSDEILFRFESDLEFRGPFSPRVLLTGQVVMKRNPMNGLISSYQEIWDNNVWDVVKGARLQV